MSIATAPSWQNLYDIGRAALQARNPNLKVNLGDVTDAVLAGGATMASQIISFAAGRFLATFLDGSFGVDLTNLARDRGVTRDDGDAAIGSVTFTRASAGLGAGTVPAGTRVANQADTTGAFSIYTTNVDVVFTGADLGPHAVAATCTKIGKAGSVANAVITRILDNLWDPTLLVTNPALFAGGSEQESDPDLRDRVRGFFLTEARGTVDALVFGAKTVAGVKRASVSVDYSTGIVTVYVSDANGNSNPTMTSAVYTELTNHWADAGDVLSVIGANLIIQSIDVSLTVRIGTDVNALLNNVRSAIIARVARLAPGETLFRDMISAAARDVDRINILQVAVNTPSVSIAPAVGQEIRTDSAHVTFS